MKTDVAIKTGVKGYPKFPYHPTKKYNEYPLDFNTIDVEDNNVYDAVRENFYRLGLDADNYGTQLWNPLKQYVKPGTTVFIKPNFVDHKHRYGGDIWSVITHPSVIRAVADYVAIALKGRGTIIIGDNPHVDTDFSKVIDLCKLKELKEFYETNFKITCKIVDCRNWHMPDLKYYGFKGGRKRLAGDPQGEVKVNIGKKSLFKGTNPLLFRGTYNERLETIYHHSFGRHQYFFSKSIFFADTYISIPKLKTHAKVGVTLNIKGLIGTISNKNCLVHWRIVFPTLGGDEYPNPDSFVEYFKLYFQHFLFSIIPSKLYFILRNFLNRSYIGTKYNNWIAIKSQKQKMLRGAFSTNDTTWRMTVDVHNAFVKDINKIREKHKPGIKVFSVIDGVVAGEKDGPHFPEKKNAGVIISGADLLSVDLVAARLMNINYLKVKYLEHLSKTELLLPMSLSQCF